MVKLTGSSASADPYSPGDRSTVVLVADASLFFKNNKIQVACVEPTLRGLTPTVSLSLANDALSMTDDSTAVLASRDRRAFGQACTE
ncbi:hypothetical protein [Bradyrhizobium manausense]|uniref:Uncharacterized protein n=1 Tax=Bradyrhizobium manausense TaxID=989370 RepID=A0A0R3E2P1_9BRAD|nr:hypothetical protein [Bradyrhizobium manausense]KRQ14702.1 hypothetical protein AOQ71_12525 [Bradyrhizobium manausense]